MIDGVAVTTLAAQYGLDESSIRRKIKPSTGERANGIPTLRHLAEKKIEALSAIAVVDEQIGELPATRQIIVHDLVARMQSISVHLTCAAETSAATARKLALLAGAQVDRIDASKPMTAKTREIVTSVSAITKTANEAGAIGLGLLSANREMMKAPPADTHDVADLTDDELAAELAKHGV